MPLRKRKLDTKMRTERNRELEAQRAGVVSYGKQRCNTERKKRARCAPVTGVVCYRRAMRDVGKRAQAVHL